jgi:hypothetical protein
VSGARSIRVIASGALFALGMTGVVFYRSTSRPLATLEDHLVAKLARPMFELPVNASAHVRSLKQRRGYLVDQCVGGTDTIFQICSYNSLAGSLGQGRAAGQPLSKVMGFLDQSFRPE